MISARNLYLWGFIRFGGLSIFDFRPLNGNQKNIPLRDLCALSEAGGGN
jgi:hypothetical protein